MKVYDPQGRKHGEALLKDAEWCASALEAAIEADIVVVLTEWNEFRAINLATLKSRMRGTMLLICATSSALRMQSLLDCPTRALVAPRVTQLV